MICAVIKGPSLHEARQQLTQAQAYASLVELRLDGFTDISTASIQSLRSQCPLPMIFTLRSPSQGGNYSLPETQRLKEIRRLANLQPEYLDVEYDVPSDTIQDLLALTPNTKLILSYHNFENTPEDLHAIYQQMRSIHAHYYKIAATAHCSLDALRFMCWAKKKQDSSLIAISMGNHGQISRILAPIMGSPFTYAAIDDNQTSAPGQLSAKELIEKYHYQSLTPHTSICGLIGDPVNRSISDETHNKLCKASGLDAVYVKIQVKPEELPTFMTLAKEIPFHGLSVTMPLKEQIIPLLDDIHHQAAEIGAVNTLHFTQGKVAGYNTDAVGALDAIEKAISVKGKRIVMLGSGGAAKAIAYEAIQRGGQVVILNRSTESALELALKLNCVGKGLDHMAACAAEGYDILINCTPVELPILPEHILPKAIVMDITTKPKETSFLKCAKEKGCQVIYGYQMFVEQALHQFGIWFKKRFETQSWRPFLDKSASDSISFLTPEKPQKS